jgi:hypothetical protein
LHLVRRGRIVLGGDCVIDLLGVVWRWGDVEWWGELGRRWWGVMKRWSQVRRSLR